MRRGHSLPEALCALALGGLLAAASGTALRVARQAIVAGETTTRGGRAEREAVAILRQALENGGAVIARGDTAVELDFLLGVGVACGAEAQAIMLPWSTATALTAIPQLPGADDLVALRGWTAGAEDWWYGMLDSVQLRQPAAPCAVADGWLPTGDSSAQMLRLTFVDTLPAALEAGAEVRVYRRGRFALYHMGRGEWSLGWRRCHPWSAVCGPIQPIVGPLVAPGAGGFRVQQLVGGGGGGAGGGMGWEVAARGVGGRGASARILW